jgi:hypothetical protein
VTSGPYDDRKRLTFEQAEGAAPLPAQLKLKELSDELRALLWRVVHDSLVTARQSTFEGGGPYLTRPWSEILRDMHTYRDHQPTDEFNYAFKHWNDKIKLVFYAGRLRRRFWLDTMGAATARRPAQISRGD